MILNPENNSAKSTTLLSLITSIYLPLYLLLVVYTDNLYKIGNFHFLPHLFVICGVEVAKFNLITFFTDCSFGKEKSKIKKFYLKLKVKEIIKTIYVFIGSTAIFYVIAVLFGAPFTSKYEETLMFSLLITSLAIFPSCLHLGADNTISLITGASHLQNRITDLFLKSMRLTLVGAWAGAMVIPLDWNKPWQNWPISCCIGTIIGFLTSHLLVLMKSIPVPYLNKFK